MVLRSHLQEKALRLQLKAVPAILTEARKKICSRAVTTEDTVQQMVFQPGSDYARVWVRR